MRMRAASSFPVFIHVIIAFNAWYASVPYGPILTFANLYFEPINI